MPLFLYLFTMRVISPICTFQLRILSLCTLITPTVLNFRMKTAS